MKKFFLVCALSVFVLTVTLSAQDATREFSRNSWYTRHIQFSYSELIADNTISSFHPATSTSMEWTEISFENFVDGSGWIDTGASMSIGLLSTLPADQSSPDVMELVNVDDPQARLGQDYTSWNSRVNVPIISPVEITQLNNDTIQGVRFLIIDAETGADFYVFEGATLDEQYVISAYIPLASIGETGFDLDLLDSLITSMIVTNPAGSFLTNETSGVINYAGISFSYDPNFAYRIQVNAIPPVSGEEAEFNMYGVSPSWQRFIFVSEPRLYDTYVPPSIYAFPINEFPEGDTVYGGILADLQTILSERPDLMTLGRALPEIPPVGASQVFAVHAEYLDFDGGLGIRYITHHAQDISPVTDTSLVYTFIGVLDDGETVVSARFPLYMDSLMTMDESLAMDYGAFMETYETYIADVEAEIAGFSSDAFVPSLDALDAIVMSIQAD